jgi:hypothetical protein
MGGVDTFSRYSIMEHWLQNNPNGIVAYRVGTFNTADAV